MYYDARTPLITAEEAVEKADICCLLSDMQRAHEIFTAFLPRIRAASPDRFDWECDCLFGTIFFAGRVQGIREERARRKAAAERKAARSKCN